MTNSNSLIDVNSFQIHNFQEILVRDAKLKPDAVETMLKHIYSDFKDVAGIDSASVWDVLYAGNQFSIVSQQQLWRIDEVCLLFVGTETFLSKK